MNFEAPVTAKPSPMGDEEALRARRGLILKVAGALALLIVAALVLMRVFGGGEQADETPGAPLVTVITPGLNPVASTVSATGSIAARREMPVGVVGEGGAVAAVLVEPGDWVAQGQVLARIDRSVQVEQSRSLAASLGVAQADARLAQNELDRARALVSRGFISKADIDRKTAARDQATARVRVAQAQLNEQQARNGRLDIRAPAAGLVLTRDVEPGQIVGAGGAVLFRIARGGEMEMLARVAETDLPGLSVGARAKVTPVGNANALDGQVWQISPVVDPVTRQGLVRIALSYARDVRPGGFASASLIAGEAERPLVPESALQSDDKGSYVLIVNAADTVERRDVKVGQVSDKGVTILSGLTGSERIVALAGGFLAVGQKVRPEVAAKP